MIKAKSLFIVDLLSTWHLNYLIYIQLDDCIKELPILYIEIAYFFKDAKNVKLLL